MKQSRPGILSALSSVVLLCGASVATVEAHHSAAQFDFMHQATVRGNVKSFRVMNPHTRAVISITDAKGTRDVEFEGHSASNFFRSGFLRDDVKTGDSITVVIAPRRDGADGGFIMGFTTASGHTVGFGGLSPSTGEKEPSGTAK